MNRLSALCSVVVLVSVVGCVERTATELRPAISPMTNLPVDICTEASLTPLAASVRNLGDDDIVIASVAFVADASQPDGLASFGEPVLDKTTLLGDEEAFIQFDYGSPGGVPQKATLVINSDAEVNPVLEIPVETSAVTDEQRVLANCAP